MAVGTRLDPYLALNFLVEIDGLVTGGFSDVSGLDVQVELDTIREGGVNEYVHVLPAGTKYPNIVLKRGLTDSDVLWRWYRDVCRGRVERRSGSVVLLDRTGTEKWRWTFTDAYPVRWTGPQFEAGYPQVAIETLELVHRGITRGR